MSACKLTCVRKKKKQSANLNEVDGGQELVEGSHSTNPVPSQQLPTTSSGTSIVGSSSPRVKGLCKAEACPENCPKICSPSDFQESNLLPNKTVCGIQNFDRIYGGMQTDLDEHPWTVLIKYDKPRGYSFNCGGVLISSRYVMTAAHCLKKLPKNWRVSQVRLGEWNLTSSTDCLRGECSPDPLDVDIDEVIIHENYKSSDDKHDDIALLRLVRDISFNDFVKPICLPIDLALKNNTFENYDLEVAGWGKTETRATSDIKLKVKVTVRNTQDCQKVYDRLNVQLTENQFCAGGLQGQDSCKGDSGGSIMGPVDATTNWVAVGIVSYGAIPCGSAGWPGVYTRVTSYVDWILSKMRP